MVREKSGGAGKAGTRVARPSAVGDTRVIYCGDNLDQLKKLPDGCVGLVAIDPPFNSNRNYEVFWGETKENRAFEDRHTSTQAYIEFMRPRCVELRRVLTVARRKPLPPRHQAKRTMQNGQRTMQNGQRKAENKPRAPSRGEDLRVKTRNRDRVVQRPQGHPGLQTVPKRKPLPPRHEDTKGCLV